MEEIRTSVDNLRKLAAWAANTYDAEVEDSKTRDCSEALKELYELLDSGWQAIEPGQDEPDLSDLYGKLEEVSALMDGPLMRLKDTNEYLAQVCDSLQDLKLQILYYKV